MSERVGLFLRRVDDGATQERVARLDSLIAALAEWFGREPTGPSVPMPRGHLPTQTDADGVIETPEGKPPRRLSDAIKVHWPRDVWTDAARVSYYESSWKYDAELNTLWRGGGRCGVSYWYSDEVGWATTEQSIGYFQINRCAHGGTVEYWYDADHNAAKGAELYLAGGWRPWEVTSRRLGLL